MKLLLVIRSLKLVIFKRGENVQGFYSLSGLPRSLVSQELVRHSRLFIGNSGEAGTGIPIKTFVRDVSVCVQRQPYSVHSVRSLSENLHLSTIEIYLG